MADKRSDALVVFTPSGKRGRFPLGTSLIGAARQLGVDIDSVCGGRGICGRCKVLVSEGEFAKYGIRSRTENLSPLSEPEQRFAAKSDLETGCRLSCHTELAGDVVIDVPAASQVHRQVVRKDFQARDVEVNPVVHLHYVEVEKPKLDEPSGDLQRVCEALEKEWQLANLECDFQLMPGLQAILREDKWQVTVAVRDRREIVAIWPGFKGEIYGVATDVGSTTIASHLCDLTSGEVLASAGVMNPQIRFGEDLMSRVSYVMLNPGGEEELTQVVREAIGQLIDSLLEDSGVAAQDVLELTFVGNPIMHHLLLGMSPAQLGVSPFALATDTATSVRASNLGIQVNPGARAYVLPCIAGHVGADTAGVLLAEAPDADDAVSLVVDVGTNAEILLANRQRILAASSPTGPAFEGAQISCGQRAAPGAIERVRIDPDTLEPRFKVIGCDLWSDDPGFREALGSLEISGICGSGIIEAIAEMYLAGVIDTDGGVDGALVERSARVVPDDRTYAYVLYDGDPAVKIIQNDVRAVQLAKAALYAGVQLLTDRMGVETVERIRLAGAFGSHIDVKYAMVLGLIPDCDLSRVSAAGNAAGTGAVMALLDRHARVAIESKVREVEKVETAVQAEFQDYFVLAMAIPHKTAPFAELAKDVKLPRPAARKPREGDRSRGRRRRKSGGG
jgi:uncharacterized 2Fe-2S/4Fe-4S cluster protein (DUF4445 family)